MENTGNFEASVINFNSCNQECKKQLELFIKEKNQLLKERNQTRNTVRNLLIRLDEKDRIISNRDKTINDLIHSYNKLFNEYQHLLSESKRKEINKHQKLILLGNL